MKETTGSFTCNGKEYKTVFNLNVMEKIQDEYKTVDNWAARTDGQHTEEVDIKALIFGITEMINEAIDIDNEDNGTNEPFLTHKQVGRIITEIGFAKAAEKMNELVIESVKDDTADEKNV